MKAAACEGRCFFLCMEKPFLFRNFAFVLANPRHRAVQGHFLSHPLNPQSMKTQHLTYLLVLPFVFLLGLFSCSDDIGENPDIQTSTNYLDLIQGKLESMNMPRPEGSYNYPVYPGLEGGMYDWDFFTTREAQLGACDIAQSLTDSMSTEVLIQAIWEHPFFPEIAEEGNYQAAFDSTIAKTNAYKSLIAYWQSQDFHKKAIQDLLERRSLVKVVEGEEALPDALNVLIAQEVLYGLNYEERKLLAGEIFNPLSSKMPSVSELFVLGRLMSQVAFPPLEEAMKSDTRLRSFVEQGKMQVSDISSVYSSLGDLCTEFTKYHNDEYLGINAAKIEAMNMERPAGSYDYPVCPGMEEWSVFISTWQMVSTVEIPEDMLKEMSTEALMQGLWEYPFFFELPTSSFSLQHGYEALLPYINIGREFLSRDDAAECLYHRYEIVNVAHEGAIILARSLEVMLAQDVYLAKYNDEQLKKLIEMVYKNDIIRYGENSNVETGIMRSCSWFLIGRILRHIGYEPFLNILENDALMQIYMDEGYVDMGMDPGESFQTFTTINELGKQFLNE